MITSSEENDRLAKHMKEALGAGAELWLGLALKSSTPPAWQWDRTGEKPLCSPHWQVGQPTLDGACATLHDDGGWTNRGCTSAHSYVCERGP